nr:hypothetical protein DMDDKFKA_00165 [Haslea ostrearia]
MNRILYESRCRCNEEHSITKNRNSSTRSEGKTLQYPNPNEITFRTFKIKYEKKLSSYCKTYVKQFSK